MLVTFLSRHHYNKQFPNLRWNLYKMSLFRHYLPSTEYIDKAKIISFKELKRMFSMRLRFLSLCLAKAKNS